MMEVEEMRQSMVAAWRRLAGGSQWVNARGADLPQGA